MLNCNWNLEIRRLDLEGRRRYWRRDGQNEEELKRQGGEGTYGL